MWIVDPLDGTKEFIKGIPEFAVAIALIEDGVPALGVTYNPIKREMYWAARGVGCHLNTRRVRVTRKRTPQARDRACQPQRNRARRVAGVRGMLKVSPTGSVAYKLAMVAAGKADATFTARRKASGTSRPVRRWSSRPAARSPISTAARFASISAT